MTEPTAAATPVAAEPHIVPLDQLGIAPENLRASEPAAADIPELANTIEAVGLLFPLLVRPDRRGEAAFMALDGRRRLLALQCFREAGRISGAYGVKTEVARDKALQAAAIVISNTQRAPVHVADVIVATGKLKSLKMSAAKIAAALGYPEVEVRRLQRLAALPKPALEALKAGRISLRTAKLLARITDPDVLKAFAQNAAAGYLYEHAVVQHLRARPRLDDPMFDLIGVERYRTAGGRIDADLFGEFDDVVLDPDKLQVLSAERVGVLIEAAKARGLAVYLQGGELYRATDGLEVADPNVAARLSEEERLAWDLACTQADDLVQATSQGERHPQARNGDLLAFRFARLDQETALHGRDRIAEVGLYPEAGTGFEAQVFLAPQAVTDEESERSADDVVGGEGGDDDLDGLADAYRPEIVVPKHEIDTEGRSHSQARTFRQATTAAASCIPAAATRPRGLRASPSSRAQSRSPTPPGPGRERAGMWASTPPTRSRASSSKGFLNTRRLSSKRPLWLQLHRRPRRTAPCSRPPCFPKSRLERADGERDLCRRSARRRPSWMVESGGVGE